MGRYAVIENGLVVNVVVSEAALAEGNGWVQSDIAGPGWRYDGAKFTAPPESPPSPPSPREIALNVLRNKPDSTVITVLDLKKIETI